MVRDGMNVILAEIGGNELVLSVGKATELLYALRAGLMVDVVFLRLGGGSVAINGLVNALGKQFPLVRTMVTFDFPIEAHEAQADVLGATWIIPSAEVGRTQLRTLVEEIRSLL